MRPGVSARFRFRFHDADGEYMEMEEFEKVEGRGGALGQLVRRGMTEPCN